MTEAAKPKKEKRERKPKRGRVVITGQQLDILVEAMEDNIKGWEAGKKTLDDSKLTPAQALRNNITYLRRLYREQNGESSPNLG